VSDHGTPPSARHGARDKSRRDSNVPVLGLPHIHVDRLRHGDPAHVEKH
jgi:hypothetical protein